VPGASQGRQAINRTGLQKGSENLLGKEIVWAEGEHRIIDLLAARAACQQTTEGAPNRGPL